MQGTLSGPARANARAMGAMVACVGLLSACAAGDIAGPGAFDGPVLVIEPDAKPAEYEGPGVVAVMRSLKAANARDAALKGPDEAAEADASQTAPAPLPGGAEAIAASGLTIGQPDVEGSAVAADQTGEATANSELETQEVAFGDEAPMDDAAPTAGPADGEPLSDGEAGSGPESEAMLAGMDPADAGTGPPGEWVETPVGRCRMDLPSLDVAAQLCANREDVAAAQAALRWLGAPRLEINGEFDDPTVTAMVQFAEADPRLSISPTKGFVNAILQAGAQRRVEAKRAADEAGAGAAPQAGPWRRFLDEPDPRIALLLPKRDAGVQLHCIRRDRDWLRLFFFSKAPTPTEATLRLFVGRAEASAPLADLGDKGAAGRPLYTMATEESGADRAKSMAEFLLDGDGEITLQLFSRRNETDLVFYEAALEADSARAAVADLLANCRI